MNQTLPQPPEKPKQATRIQRRSKVMETILIETDIPNPIDGGNLYASVRPQSLAWWLYARSRLFASILWRRVDDQVPGRVSIGAAWEVAAIVYPVAQWRMIQRAGRKAEVAK